MSALIAGCLYHTQTIWWLFLQQHKSRLLLLCQFSVPSPMSKSQSYHLFGCRQEFFFSIQRALPSSQSTSQQCTRRCVTAIRLLLSADGSVVVFYIVSRMYCSYLPQENVWSSVLDNQNSSLSLLHLWGMTHYTDWWKTS